MSQSFLVCVKTIDDPTGKAEYLTAFYGIFAPLMFTPNGIQGVPPRNTDFSKTVKIKYLKKIFNR